MSNTLKFGNGQWATKVGSTLAYNDENGNFKPLPFNFTRATSATRVNKDGLIEMVTNNKPRIDFLNDSNGALLLEPSRSNRITNSEDGSTWSLSNITLSSLSGGLNKEYYEITSLGNTGRFDVVSNNWVNLTAGTYTASVFAKKGTCDEIILTTRANFSFQSAYSVFNLTSGTVVSSSGVIGSIQQYSDGWYRCAITFTNSGSYTDFASFAFGFNFNSSNTDTLFVAAPQSEIGSYATSYIPTQGATATRVAEVCSQENLLTDIINASYPFTMYVDGKYNGQLSPLLSFLNIDASQQFFLIYIFDDEVFFSARSNGTIEIIESNINLVDGQEFKIAVTMENSTSGKICVNGNSVTVKNNFSSQIQNSNITDLLIGQERVVSDGGVRSSVSGLKLYNEALTDQELINLTTI